MSQPAFNKNGWPSVQTVLTMTLMSLFSLLVYRSIMDYNEKQVSVVNARRFETLLQKPAFTICTLHHFPKSEQEAIHAFRNVKKLADNLVLKVKAGIVDRNETTYKNILDEDNRETPGHDGKFTYSMLVQNIYVEPCITIEMPGWHKTGLFSMNRIYLNADFDGLATLVVTIHKRNHFFPTLNAFYGASHIFLSPPLKTREHGEPLRIPLRLYKMSRKYSVALNLPKTPCQQKEDYDMNRCFQTFLEQEIGCQLPWAAQVMEANSQLPENCTNAQVLKYISTVRNISAYGEKSNFDVTGCLPACRRFEYFTKSTHKAENSATSYTNKTDNAVIFGSYFITADYEERQQVLRYSESDILADVGGYMGLLLGYSVLSIFDFFDSLRMRLGYIRKK